MHDPTTTTVSWRTQAAQSLAEHKVEVADAQEKQQALAEKNGGIVPPPEPIDAEPALRLSDAGRRGGRGLSGTKL